MSDHGTPRRTLPPTTTADVGGPVVAVCTGHRCAALHRLAGQDETAAGLRRTIAGTRGGVLLTTGCPGACSRAPVVGLGLRSGPSLDGTSLVWLGGSDRPQVAEDVQRWLRSPGPLLPALVRAVVGVSGDLRT